MLNRIYNCKVLIVTLLAIMIVYSCKNKNTETKTDNSSDSNNVDITVSQSDTSLTLNLFYINLKSIQDLQIFLNDKSVDYKSLNDEMLSLDVSKLNLGKNNILIKFKHNGKGVDLQRVVFRCLNLKYELLNSYNHHSQYFTEGLYFDQNKNLVESMGMEGKSRIVFYKGLKVKDSILNEQEEFGEGVVGFKDKIVQLLWKNNYIKIFDSKTKKLIKDLQYDSEGWGLTTDGNKLYASNGSNQINIINIDGDKTQIVETITVNDQNGPVNNLNELEFIDGLIFSNIWQTNTICVINPKNGNVVAKIDCSELAEKERSMNMEVDVLNGIAYDKFKNTLYLTGKYWKKIYEVKLKNSDKIFTL